MLSTYAIPHKTAYGTKVIQHPTLEERKKLDLKLRQLLILVDGQKDIANLLASSVFDFDIQAFEMLYQQGYIAFENDEGTQTTPPATTSAQTPAPTSSDNFLREKTQEHLRKITPAVVPATTKGDFSKTRFDCLDIMLDLSMEDFSVRPWIDKFEATKDLIQLERVVLEFAKSPLGQAHSNVVMQLRRLF